MTKSIIIIGAGMGGLAAGIYGQTSLRLRSELEDPRPLEGARRHGEHNVLHARPERGERVELEQRSALAERLHPEALDEDLRRLGCAVKNCEISGPVPKRRRIVGH